MNIKELNEKDDFFDRCNMQLRFALGENIERIKNGQISNDDAVLDWTARCSESFYKIWENGERNSRKIKKYINTQAQKEKLSNELEEVDY